MPVLLLAAIQVIGDGLAGNGQPQARPLDGLGYALLVAGPLVLLVRRRWPLPALGLVLAGTLAYLAFDYPRGPFFLAAVIALIGAARRARAELVWATVAGGYLGYLALTLFTGNVGGVPVAAASLSRLVVLAVVLAVAVALAEAVRIRAEHYREMARAHAEATRARREQTRRQASDERLRIARELHDVLGHHLSLINVRAGVALHLLDSRPDEAREALDAIKVASAEALREVRGVLAALHPVDESAPRSPTPVLAQVDQLVEEARAAGLDVTLRREGMADRLPAEVDRAAYRIIQEALTNVRRHAGPAARVTVVVGYAAGRLTIRVDDTGVGPVPAAMDEAGNGIPGMRERAAALGGSLSTGPAPGGGFRVEATLPLAGANVDAA